MSGIRAVGGAEARPVAAEAPAAKPQASSANANDTAAIVTTTALDAGQPPVDVERVSQIRKAVQSGSYPLIPAKISDAMIAAGIMLQVRN